MDLENRND